MQRDRMTFPYPAHPSGVRTFRQDSRRDGSHTKPHIWGFALAALMILRAMTRTDSSGRFRGRGSTINGTSAVGEAFCEEGMRDRTTTPVRPEDVLAGLYGSLNDPDAFEQPLQFLAKIFRSHMSGLHTHDLQSGQANLQLIGPLDAAQYQSMSELYSQRWTGENLWMQRSTEGFVRQGFQHGEAVVSTRELVSSPYYQHFLKLVDIHYGLGISIGTQESSQIAIASFHRDVAAPGFDQSDFTLVRWIRPHLANAYALHRRLALARSEAHLTSQMVKHAGLGMFRLSHDGALEFCNMSAEAMFARSGSLAQGLDGRLAFSGAKVRAAIRIAARTCAEGRGPTSFRIDGDEAGDAGLVVHLHAVPDRNHNGRCALFVGFVTPLTARQNIELMSAIVQSALGLTAAEARVALAMHADNDVEIAAPKLGIKVSTMRGHIKHIYGKLGISRHGELVLRVERCLSGVPHACAGTTEPRT